MMKKLFPENSVSVGEDRLKRRGDLILFFMLFALCVIAWKFGATGIAENVASGLLGGVLMYVKGRD